MILYENMELIEHVLRHPICTFSHLACACKHCNIKLSLYYWTHGSCWWIYHFFARFFVIKLRHTDRLKNRSRWKKPSVGALVTCGKTPATVTWRKNLKIFYRAIVTPWRPRVQQSASKFRNLSLQQCSHFQGFCP